MQLIRQRPALSFPGIQKAGFGEVLEDLVVEYGEPALPGHTHVDVFPLDGGIEAAERKQKERVFVAADLWEV